MESRQTTKQCLEHFQHFITDEKKGPGVFLDVYDETILDEKARIGADMVTRLREDGCGMEAATDLALLTLYDIVILIDDSPSMVLEEVVDAKALRIEGLKATLREITKVYDLANPKGLSVRFMNSEEGKKGINNQNVNIVLDNHIYDGVTRIGTELYRKILKPFVLDPSKPLRRPLLVMIMTDGAQEGEAKDLLKKVILNCADTLKNNPKLGHHAVAFHFSRVGNDKGATDLLQNLSSDKDLEGYVSCLPMTEFLQRLPDPINKWTALLKLLVGPLVQYWKNQDTNGPSPDPDD